MPSKFLASVLAAAAMVLAVATTGAAQPRQTGLVNINVSQNTVQIPIGIAANICDVSVFILASEIEEDGTAHCDAAALSTATVTDGPGGGAATQDGLINVNIQGNNIQVPIAAAANICGVTVLALVTDVLLSGDTSCDARANSRGNRQ